MFTLGEESWREVVITVVPDSRCDLDAGIVDVNGTTYWITVAGNVMSFDLEEETITPMNIIPSAPERKLGVAYQETLSMIDTTEVLVMEKPRCLRPWLSLQVWPSRSLTVQRPRGHQRLTRPHFVQDSGHVLTWGSTCGYGGLYKHKPRRSDNVNDECGLLQIHENNQGTMVADIKRCSDTCAFTYVESKESLSELIK